MSAVRVRFAPSPTGALHIGGVRTALYNVLLARKAGGTFILRIEDTDQGRFVPGAEAYIMESLEWLGLVPAESPKHGGKCAPYRQSERKAMYRQYAEQLLHNGDAYYAFDTPEALENARKNINNFKYDAKTRGQMRNSLTLPQADVDALVAAGNYVIRLKTRADEEIVFDDTIRGTVHYNTNDIDDKILLKSDGMPTYHLANVVDDHLMEITHVIRGEEWLPSTPTHILLYRYLGWEATMPVFAHLPLILRPDGKGKLSKRDGAKFGIPVFPMDWDGGKLGEDPIKGFRQWGFQPEAVINFLALLGWSPKEGKEVLTMDELVQQFDLSAVHKAGARFDFDKAKWFNQQYLMAMSNEALAQALHPFAQQKGYTTNPTYLASVCGLMKERVHFLTEFCTEGYFFFEMPDYEQVKQQEEKNISKKVLKTWDETRQTAFQTLRNKLAALPDFSLASLTQFTDNLENEVGMGKGDVFPALRLALSGTLQGPGVLEMMELLGKEESIKRLSAFFKAISGTDAPKNNIPQVDINKQLVDLRVTKILKERPDWFADVTNNEKKKQTRAFTILAVAAYLNEEEENIRETITDGSGDAGVDAIYIGGIQGVEFDVILFQSKYNELNKEANFPANAIEKMLVAVASLFDLNNKNWHTFNPVLQAKLAEIHSLLAEGYIPLVRCVCVNNGLKWNADGERMIAQEIGQTVQFDHFNHNNIVSLLKSPPTFNAQLDFVGDGIADDFNYKRVIVGKVCVKSIAQLLEKYGDGLFEKNIRRYLGLRKNRVNTAIKNTLMGDKRDSFYFFNNGITIVCSKFKYNALQKRDWIVNIENLQIINGGQTCKTIHQTLAENPNIDYSQVYVLVRLYELSGNDMDSGVVSDITVATNSQTPVDLRDLRANDSLQKGLEIAMKDMGYTYRRKKDSFMLLDASVMPSSVVAEAVLSIWRKKPHIAKFKQAELFGNFYHEVFDNLNGAQAVLAVLMYRYCDNQRRKEELVKENPHLPYSNFFVAMLMGHLLLAALELSLKDLTHNSFEKAKGLFETKKEALFKEAVYKLNIALQKDFQQGFENVEKRKLSAIFRSNELVRQLGI